MSLQATGLFIASGLGLLGYFFYEKDKIEKQRESSKSETYGKPKVGGPFSLVRDDGTPVTNLDFLGKYMLIYFGYTVMHTIRAIFNSTISFVLMFVLKNWKKCLKFISD